MSHTATRSYINDVLRILGSNGLSGMTFPSRRMSEVSSSILSMLSLDGTISAQRLMAELRRQDLVLITKLDDSIKVQLSVKGIHRLQRAEMRSSTVPTQQLWDGKWRMVVFDIPARHADSRYLLTSELKRLGFVMLQNSMWIHPYPCFEQISAVIQYANLQPFITFAEISSIDNRSQQKLVSHYPNLLA